LLTYSLWHLKAFFSLQGRIESKTFEILEELACEKEQEKNPNKHMFMNMIIPTVNLRARTTELVEPAVPLHVHQCFVWSTEHL